MTNDEALAAKFAPLEPDDVQLGRTAARVLERFHPERRPLWREWLDFFAARPVVHVSYALAAAVLLGLLSPLSALPGLIQRTSASVATIVPSSNWRGALAMISPSPKAEGAAKRRVRGAKAHSGMSGDHRARRRS